MVTLSFAAVYIINQVKLRRLVLGISARDLSRLIEMSDSYVSSIESMATKGQYTTNELSKIALVLKCEVHDFYPPDELLSKNDGSNVFKKIISLSEIEDTLIVIDGLINAGFFKNGKSVEDVARHLFVYGKREATVVQETLDINAKHGKLTLTNGSYIQP